MVWVSIADGTLVRSDMIIEADTKVVTSGADTGMGGGNPGGGGTGRPAGGKLGGGGAGAGRGIDVINQGPGAAGFGSGGPGGRPGAGQGGNQGGGSNSGVFIRMKLYIKMVLEK